MRCDPVTSGVNEGRVGCWKSWAAQWMKIRSRVCDVRESTCCCYQIPNPGSIQVISPPPHLLLHFSPPLDTVINHTDWNSISLSHQSEPGEIQGGVGTVQETQLKKSSSAPPFTRWLPYGSEQIATMHAITLSLWIPVRTWDCRDNVNN